MKMEEAFKLPLRRTYFKVFTATGQSAFDFPMQFLFPNACLLSEKDQDDIISILNGKKGFIEDIDLSYREGVIYKQGQPFIVIRNWGYLTGKSEYALGLDIEEAKKLQIEFAEWIIDTLTQKRTHGNIY